jgi:hypothetical protein
MKKIPTVFTRDWEGNRSRVVNSVNPLCRWVADGEGWATRKLDGTCCRIHIGMLYKRREILEGDLEPAMFEREGYDRETSKVVGWVPVGDGPDDRWHREAFAADPMLPDGTYELVGPKIQLNPENYPSNTLVPHGSIVEEGTPRDFDGMRAALDGRDIEGLVFYHPDGRMAKIKLRDFGLKRVVKL